MSTTLKIVDDLGQLEQQIAKLQAEQESLKNQLKLMGAGTYAGERFVTTITNTPERKTVSWASVAKALNAPEELVTKFTKISYDIMSAETKPLVA